MASLLAASKAGGRSHLTPEELALAERSIAPNPELTIEPIFNSLQPNNDG